MAFLPYVIIAKIYIQQSFQASISKQIQNSFVRQCSNSAAEKGKKIVGYWLLGCSGMVFVAVILGGTFAYAALIIAICSVLSSFLPITVK